MKEDIHPSWYPEAKVSCACGNSWTTGATVPEIRTDVCSACHPFYTGEQRIVDTEGQVERFMKRLQAREELRTATDEQTTSAPADHRLEDLEELSTRTANALIAAGVETTGEFLNRLEDVGDEGVLEISGFGRKGLVDMKRLLRQLGYELPEAEEA